MDALILLREAEDAGLSVEVQGDKLIVQGPRAAEPKTMIFIGCTACTICSTR